MSERNLEELRKELNEIDNSILDLLAKRKNVVEDVREFKKKNNIAFFQPDREKQIFERIEKLAEEKGLNSEIAVNIFKKIVEEFRNSEMK